MAIRARSRTVSLASPCRLAFQKAKSSSLFPAFDDDEQAVVVGTPGHQVVDDPALVVQQHRILLLAGLQDFIVAGHEPFELGGRVGAGDLALAHVGHVEQTGVFAGPAVFGQDPFVLDRHVIAAEAHHAGPQRAVRGVQGRGLQGLVGHGSGFRGRVLGRSSAGPRAPAVLKPERFRRPNHVALLRRRAHRGRLSSVRMLSRSVCLSVSGAVAPSASRPVSRPRTLPRERST